MEFDDPLEELRFGVVLTARTWKLSVDVCKPKPGIAQAVIKLYGVMSRVLQAATNAQGHPKNLGELCKGTMKILINCRGILLAYKALAEHEQSIVDFGLEAACFSDRQEEVFEYFRNEFLNRALQFSRLLIPIAMGSAYKLKRDMEIAGEVLNFAVNLVTAKLLAESEFRFSLLVLYPRPEAVLWTTLHAALSREGFSESFLAKYQILIIDYVKTVEFNSSFTPISNERNEYQYQVSYNTLLNDQAVDHDKSEDRGLVFRIRSLDESTSAGCNSPKSENGDGDRTIAPEETKTIRDDTHASHLPRLNGQEAAESTSLNAPHEIQELGDEDDTAT